MSTDLLTLYTMLAQDVSPLQDEAIPRWIVIIVSIVLFGLISWGSFMNAKRTHQD